MKRYNQLICLSLLLYVVVAVSIGLAVAGPWGRNWLYKVEINRLMAEIGRVDDTKNAEDVEGAKGAEDAQATESMQGAKGVNGIQTAESMQGIGAAENTENSWDAKSAGGIEDLAAVDLGGCQEVVRVVYLPAEETDKDRILDFYDGVNGAESTFRPLYSEETIEGYLRFDYIQITSARNLLLLSEGALFLLEAFVLGALFYLKIHLVRPFHRMQGIVYEMAKGNLQGEIKEDKNRYLGKFLWGVSALRDALAVSRKRELELLREKKMLILSLSHDIRTPLNMIKLYAKALGDGIYTGDGERTGVYAKIGEKAARIEGYVGEIAKASREDVLHIEVEEGEFYLGELVGRMEAVYGEKCELRKCSLTIGRYQNRIFRGDLDRFFEVFENLFSNAFKYGDGRRIDISFYEEAYCQFIRMFNTGELVAEKDFVHLFDSFFRGGNVGGQQGDGLGLYICREIMHKMGGDIFAEREEGGMAFIVVLEL